MCTLWHFLCTSPHLFLYRSSLFDKTKCQFDRLAFVIVSIKAGVEHLRDKFVILPEDEFEITRGPIEEDTLPDVIRSSGDVLVDVHTKTKDSELQMHLSIQDSKFTELKRSASRGGNLQNRRPMSHGYTESIPFNQRITLPSAKEATAFDVERDCDTGFGEVDAEEEISRDGVKKASSNIIATEERRQLRSRKTDDG